MSKYPFPHMAAGDSVLIRGKRLPTVRAAAWRYGEMGVQQTTTGDCRVIKRGDPDCSRMYILTDPADWTESVVLYGPAPYDQCVKVRSACTALAGVPTAMRFSSLGRGDGIFNDLDLSGLGD